MAVWDVNQPDEPLTLLTGYSGTALTLDFSPEGRHLVAGGEQGELVVWDLAKPEQPQLLRTAAEGAENVLAVAFSSDSSRMATAGSGRGIDIWRVSDLKRPLYQLQASHSPVRAIHLSEDRMQIISPSVNGQIDRWNLSQCEQAVP